MTDKTQRLLILGASGLALEVAELAEQIPGYVVAGFVQNLWPERRSEALEGIPLYYIDEIQPMIGDHVAVCASGNMKRIDFIRQAEQMGVRFATLVHPFAVVSRRSRLGEGTIVGAGAVVGSRTRLGQHVIVSRNSSIGHDTVVEHYVFIGPGANIAGACKISEAVFIGIGAVVRDHLSIGERSVIGAGATVLRDVPPRVVLSAPRSTMLK